MIKRTITTLAIAAMLALQLALPAWAYGVDSGSISCGPNYVAVRSYTTEGTYHQVPNGTTVRYEDVGPSWTYLTTATYKTGPSWRALSLDGQLNQASTYAYCWGS